MDDLGHIDLYRRIGYSGLCHRRLVVEYRYKIFVAFVVRTGTSLVRRQPGRHIGTLP